MMQIFTIELKADQLGPDGTLRPEARAAIHEKSLGEAAAKMGADFTPELRESLKARLDAAIDAALNRDTREAAYKQNVTQLGLALSLQTCERALEMLESIPEGLRLIAKAASSDNRLGGNTIFELGQASSEVNLSTCSLHVAILNLQHLIECQCGLGGAAKTESASPAAPEPAASAAPIA